MTKQTSIRAPLFFPTTQILLLVLVLTALAYFASPVVLPVLLAWVLSMTLKPPVNWLRSLHFPAPLAAALVVTVFILVVGYGILHLGRPAVEWAKTAPETIPQLKQKFSHILQPFFRISAVATTAGDIAVAEEVKKNPTVEVKDNHVAGWVFTWTGTLLAGVGETIALIFLLLATGDLCTQKFMSLLSNTPDKKEVIQICHEIQQNVSRYLFTVGTVNLGLGAIISIAMFLTGMPNPLMWGAIAALANFIPYFGPVLGMIAVGLAGLIAFDTLGRGLLPVGAYFVIHLIEANLITPFVLGRRFTMNPVIIFVSLMFCIWLWGIIGALLAVPLLVTLKVMCDHLPSLSSLGDFLSSEK